MAIEIMHDLTRFHFTFYLSDLDANYQINFFGSCFTNYLTIDQVSLLGQKHIRPNSKSVSRKDDVWGGIESKTHKTATDRGTDR